MNLTEISNLLNVETLVFGMLVTALLLAFARLLLGPDLADRVVALDMVAITSVALIIAYTVFTDESAFLDAAIVVALFGFLGTVAFARSLERRARRG